MVRDSCELCWQTLVIPNTRENQSQFLNLETSSDDEDEDEGESLGEDDADFKGAGGKIKGKGKKKKSKKKKGKGKTTEGAGADLELGKKLSSTKRLKKKKKRPKLRPMKELSKRESGEIQVRGMDLDAIKAVQKGKAKVRASARKLAKDDDASNTAKTGETRVPELVEEATEASKDGVVEEELGEADEV